MKCLVRKIKYQRCNSKFLSIFCELILPLLLLLFLIIIKGFVQDPIIYEDKYDQNPITYGPLCYTCTNKDLVNYFPFFNFSLSEKIGISRDYNPVRICQLFNDTAIGLIGDFKNAELIKPIFEMLGTQNMTDEKLPYAGDFQFEIKPFKNNSELEDYLNDPYYKISNSISNIKEGICVGIELINIDNVFYATFRFNDDYLWKDAFQNSKVKLEPSTTIQTNSLNNYIKGNITLQQFTQGGFIMFQSYLMEAILFNFSHTYRKNAHQIYVSPLHNPRTIIEYKFLNKITTFLQIIIGIGFFPIFFRVSKTFGNEKESKIICLMYMKGMKRNYYWVSWILEYLAVSLVLSILCSILTKYGFFFNTNCFLLIIFYFIHCMNEYSLSLFFSSFLNTFNISIIIGGTFYFVSMLLGIMINTYDFNFSVIGWTSLIPPIGGISFITLLADFEINKLNLTLSKFQERIYFKELILLIIIQFFSTIIFSIIGIFLNLVTTNSLGLPKFFHPGNYKCETSKKRQSEQVEEFKLEIPQLIFNFAKNNQNNLNLNGSNNNQSEEGKIHEEKKEEKKEMQNFIDNNGKELNNDLKIFDIKKMKESYELESSNNNQLHNDKIKLDEGDILVLVGRNGSGKSTFLNLISKLINKTGKHLEGNRLKNLENIEKQLEENKYAICSNDGIFSPDFTLEENLIIFDLLAGLGLDPNPKNTASQFFSEFVSKDNIADLYKQSPDDISTGMRRLLSLSIAYSGNPGIILLDNPTIGMDISLRREIHDKIQKISKSKITILATQNVEEAELLGTKYVILEMGKFLFYDSLLSFKEGWHTYYTLTIEHKIQLYQNQNQNQNRNAQEQKENNSGLEESGNIKENQIQEMIDKLPKDTLISKEEELIRPSIKKLLNTPEERKKQEKENKMLYFFNYSTEKVVKFALSFRKLEPEKWEIFFRCLKASLPKYNIKNFSFGKQSIEDVLFQILSNDNSSNNSSQPIGQTPQNDNDSQNSQKCSQRVKDFFIKKIQLFLFKRIFDILFSQYLYCLLFTLLLFTIINFFTYTVHFEYKQQIPKIAYNFSTENLPFYYEIADQKYKQYSDKKYKNNSEYYVEEHYNKFYEYLVKIPNSYIIEKPHLSSTNLRDSIKNFHSFIYNQSKISSTYSINSLQSWRLMSREYENEYENYSQFHLSTLISYINTTNPLYIGLSSSHLINTIFRCTTDNKSSIIFSNYPQPPSSYTRKMLRLKLALIPIGFYIFSLSLMSYIIAYSIIKEIKQGSYYIQKLYGKWYLFWIPNLLFHILESCLITSLFLIFLVYFFKFTIDNIWRLSLIHSISIIAFYYCWIIIWKSTIIITMSADLILLINIVIGNIISPLFQVLTRFDELKFSLGILEKILQFIFPTFALHQGLFYSLFKQSKAYYPEDTNYTQIENNIKFSMIGMSSFLILYIMILILFEARNIANTKYSKIFGKISSTILGTNKGRNYNPPNHINTNLDTDSDRNENRMTSRIMNQFSSPDYSHPDSQLKKDIRLPFLYKSCNKHILRSSDFDNIAFAQYLKNVKEKFCCNSESPNQNGNDGIGFCTENCCAILNLSVRKNLEFYLLLEGYDYNSRLSQEADTLMKKLKIYCHSETYASNLSDGEKTLLNLAISIIGNPSLLLVENLSSKLDPLARIELWNLFSYDNHQFNKIPMILLSDNLEESLTLSNSFLHLSNNILKDKSFSELILPEDINFYNMKFSIPFLTEDQLNEFFNLFQHMQFNSISDNYALENIKEIYKKCGISDFSKNISPNEIVKKLKKIEKETLDLNDFYRIFVPLKTGLEFLEEFKKECKITIPKDQFLFSVMFNNSMQNISELFYRFYVLNLQKQIDLIRFGTPLVEFDNALANF